MIDATTSRHMSAVRLRLSCSSSFLSACLFASLSACSSPAGGNDAESSGLDETGTGADAGTNDESGSASGGSSSESGASSESGGVDEGYCEETGGGGQAAFDIDVSQWPVSFWDQQSQTLDCSVTQADAQGTELVLTLNCSQDTNSGSISISATGQSDIASPVSVDDVVELYISGEFYGGGAAQGPVVAELGFDAEVFVLRNEDGLQLGGFSNVNGFEDVWTPVSLAHDRLCFREYEDFSEVPHFVAGLRVGNSGDDSDLHLPQDGVGEWTAPDGSTFLVEGGSATTWGCCHGGTSNYGLVRRLSE